MNANSFLNGHSAFMAADKPITDLPWHHHPVFPGVSMKHLVTGAETDGQISLHLVRIAPDCAIGSHAHATQWELHQVLQGAGETTIGSKRIAYSAGTVGTVPLGEKHEVRAGSDGLILLATFSPPLV